MLSASRGGKAKRKDIKPLNVEKGENFPKRGTKKGGKKKRITPTLHRPTGVERSGFRFPEEGSSLKKSGPFPHGRGVRGTEGP